LKHQESLIAQQKNLQEDVVNYEVIMRKYKKEVVRMIDGLKKDFVANLKKQIEEIQKLQLKIEEDI